MHQCKLEKPIFIAASKFTFKETDEGFFIETFLISNRINANGWMITADANKQDGKTFEGRPDIVFFNEKKQRDHTVGDTLESSLKVQEPFRKGTMLKVLGTDTGKKLTSVDKIDDKDTIGKIKSRSLFCSSKITPAIS